MTECQISERTPFALKLEVFFYFLVSKTQKIPDSNLSNERQSTKPIISPFPNQTSDENHEKNDFQTPNLNNTQHHKEPSATTVCTVKNIFPANLPNPLNINIAPCQEEQEKSDGEASCKSSSNHKYEAMSCKSGYTRNLVISPASKRWKKLKNTLIAVGHFQTTQVQCVNCNVFFLH